MPADLAGAPINYVPAIPLGTIAMDLGPSAGDAGVRSSASSGVCALRAGSEYIAVRFLMRFLETNRLMPFAIYCLLELACSVYFLT